MSGIEADARTREALHVAQLYYEQDRTMEQIAAELNVSRALARLLGRVPQRRRPPLAHARRHRRRLCDGVLPHRRQLVGHPPERALERAEPRCDPADPGRLCAVSSLSKLDALKGALAAQLITELVIEESLARRLLEG